jgi:hypothetical protein
MTRKTKEKKTAPEAAPIDAAAAIAAGPAAPVAQPHGDGNSGQGFGARVLDKKAEDFKGKKVDMNFPRRVRILVEGHVGVTFEAGIQPVPVELKDHWYLKAHGVKEV